MRKQLALPHLLWHRLSVLLTLQCLLFIVGIFIGPARLLGDDVEQGIIVLETPAASDTKFLLAARAGEFPGPGTSDAIVSLPLVLHGAALVTKAGAPSLGSGDTVIELTDETLLPNEPPPIWNFQPDGQGGYEKLWFNTRLVALRLQGSFMVTYDHGDSPTRWDVTMIMSDAPQGLGLLELTLSTGHPEDCGGSGTFKHDMVIRPKLIFKRHDGGSEFTYEGGVLGLSGSGEWVDIESTHRLLTIPLALLPRVPEGAVVIETDLEPHVEHEALREGSNIFLGLSCRRHRLPGIGPDQLVVERQQVTHTMIEQQVLEPATRVDRSFNRFEKGQPGESTSELGPGARRGLSELAVLACLGLAVALIPVRRGTK